LRFSNDSQAVSRARIRWLRALCSGALVSLLAASCIYDPDQRCGPHQHLGPNSSCSCDDGLVLEGQACVPCAENEIWENGVCICQDGFTRTSSDGGACVQGGPGTSCDPSVMPSTCADPSFPTCRDRGAGIGYCTTTCAADADCPHGFACDTSATPATCKSAAVGEGDDCTSSADCVGKDATYCETVIVHKCIVSGCSVDSPLSCSEGWNCCDVRPLGLNMTLCVPEGDCPTQ
jgi:hypothetical protein